MTATSCSDLAWRRFEVADEAIAVPRNIDAETAAWVAAVPVASGRETPSPRLR
jgi:hypothetical protein